MEILIVAYAFPPNKQVGALRAGYWYKELAKELKCNTSVITAQGDASGDEVHVVPKQGESIINKLIRDEGVVWRKNIIEYLSNHTITKPDVVIITGGPFMQFSLGKWFKKNYGAKIILDYRDPFANNPGFDNSKLKSTVKGFYEKKFNRNADALTTVNDFCGDLIENFHKKPNAIIQNGYDETVNPVLKQVDLSTPSFSYTGKFYFDPDPILKAIDELDLEIHHAGPEVIDRDLYPSEKIQSIGFVDYATAVQLIASNDVGIIQTYGEDFQSTTKIFDYIRCQRAILIVSNRFIERGSIYEELKGYPNVFWAKNDKDAIIEAIKKIKASKYISPDSSFHNKFSRKFQMKKLMALIDQIMK